METETDENDPYMKMLSLAGDIESNPGPVKYPCQICEKAVRKNQKGVACDSCDQWYHTKCMGMGSAIYRAISDNPSISWECVTCGMPNFTSSFFSSMSDCCTENRYDISDQSLLSFCSSDNADPVAHSSPLTKKDKAETTRASL